MSLSRSLAAQYGKYGIRSNVVVIGFVLTEGAAASTPEAIKAMVLESNLTPFLGEPRHIAEAVAFLASDAAEFITGAEIAVDGGLSSHAPTVAPLRAMLAQAIGIQL